MFQFKGSINVVTDINIAMQYSGTCKVIFIGELKQLPPNFIEMSILLPPIEALEQEINGNMDAYYMIYQQYLDMNPYCQEGLKSILAAAYNGANIIFYIEEGSNLSHMKFLKNYFLNKFGILLGTDKNQFMYDNRYNVSNAITLYSFIGLVTLEDILLSIQTSSDIIKYFDGRAALERIAEENGLRMSESELLNWLEQFRNRLILLFNGFQVNGKSLISWKEK